MEKKKFFGWFQMILLAFIFGLTGEYGTGAISLSNAVMKSSGQVAMSATIFGLGTTIYSLMQGPPQVLLGAWIRKQGPKRIYMVGVPLMAVVTLVAPHFLHSNISYLIVYGFLWGICYMLVSQIAKQSLISNWFNQKRGMAMNLLQSIGVLFGFLCPFMINWVLKTFGDFHYGWYSVGVTSILAFPLVFFLKDKPEDVGQYPDGIEPGTILQQKTKSAISTVYKAPADTKAIGYKDALKMPMFWIFAICASLGFAISALGFGIANTHFLKSGYTLRQITTVTSVRSLVQFSFLMLFAKISDKVEPGYIFGIIGTITSVSIWLVSSGHSMPALYFEMCISMVFAVCVNTMLPTAVCNYFGRESFPALQGVIMMIAGLISSTTSIICGLIADVNGGSYTKAFILYGFICLVCALIGFIGVGFNMNRKYKKQLTEAKAE